MTALKLSEPSEAVLLLHKKFWKEDTLLSDNAKTVWELVLIIMQQKPDNFKTNFNRIRTEEEQKENGSTF